LGLGPEKPAQNGIDGQEIGCPFSSNSMTGRTSTLPCQAPGIC
jgi:hypothetical protein